MTPSVQDALVSGFSTTLQDNSPTLWELGDENFCTVGECYVEFGDSNQVMRQGMERTKEKRLANCNINILDPD
jgi:hypothetical protein